MKIFVVIGSTGEYSDHQEWLVVAFSDKVVAERFVLTVSARARELLAKYGRGYNIPKGSNEHDPEMTIDYSGVNYNIAEVEFIDVRVETMK